jgi:hypothetical protein
MPAFAEHALQLRTVSKNADDQVLFVVLTKTLPHLDMAHMDWLKPSGQYHYTFHLVPPQI